MSELIENNGLTRGISVISRREQNGTVAGDGDPIKEEQRSQSNTDTNLGKNGDSEENSIGQNVVEKPAMEIEMPSESKTKAEIVIHSGKHFRNNVQGIDFDVKEEKENDLGKENNQRAGNGDTVFAIAMEEAHSEGGHFTETPLPLKQEGGVGNCHVQAEGLSQSFSFNPNYNEGDDSGTDEEQSAFMKELENFFKERSLEFKPPKFYGEGLNCLKLWRAVTRLGGYDQVTQCKLWRQVGESFKPPKTCTTVSWSFRCFYEKAASNQALSSGRARRDSAARAMQGWHSQRLLGNGEVGDPIIKDKGSISFLKKDKHLKSIGLPLKKKKPSSIERAVKVARAKSLKPQVDSMVVDVGAPADWVKINVRRTKDCYEVYALVPGLLREEVHVQSDPAGRLIISGEPEQPDNPWGVTSFKKVITLPSRIDPHQTSAVVTLHGQLFVRAPYEQSDL
ncbi:AT-rich interactive domain-containing protein 3 [Platanthera zijinensis]|uniref:AT-rich interactive domain-containing protein 3 n=1 Tax=Platanthera zijinensis TaxID=2320716 RepID=A0AAP0BFZ7_9ASPA